MPMSYDIDAEGRMVRVRVEGSPSYDELLACFAAYTQDPRFRPGMPILVDDRARTESPSAQEIRRMAHDSKAQPQPVEGSRCALLVASDLQFGLSRMYELMMEGGPMEVRVFRDEDEAVAWLLEPRS